MRSLPNVADHTGAFRYQIVFLKKERKDNQQKLSRANNRTNPDDIPRGLMSETYFIRIDEQKKIESME